MRIAIVGYGKMGHMIEAQAIGRGHEVVARIDPFADGASARSVDAESLRDAEVAIEFTGPESAFKNIEAIIGCGKSLVVGSTGWKDRIAEAEALARAKGVGMLHAANFSVGVNLFYRIVAEAARLVDGFEQYDAGLFEAHHRQKADSPSGTAKELARIVLANMKRKTAVVDEKLDRRPEPHELHVSSLRMGSVPGTHTVAFDSGADTIELTHTARNREGFALGAVRAAEWLSGKKGIFTMDDCFDEICAARA
jgi:4-hydroxy-tetrahydrodipicolinate reductase